MRLLIKRMGYVNVHAYYVYVHDLVKGVEDLRTTVGTAIDSRSSARARPPASTRRPSSSTRRAAAASATVTPSSTTTGDRDQRVPQPQRQPGGVLYCYFDPIDLLPEAGQRRWADPAEHELMLTEAIAAARVRQR
jgi:lysine 2,3-aminomutase